MVRAKGLEPSRGALGFDLRLLGMTEKDKSQGKRVKPFDFG